MSDNFYYFFFLLFFATLGTSCSGIASKKENKELRPISKNPQLSTFLKKFESDSTEENYVKPEIIFGLPSPLGFKRSETPGASPKRLDGPLVEMKVIEKFIDNNHYVISIKLINHNSKQGFVTLNSQGRDSLGRNVKSTTDEIFLRSQQTKFFRKRFLISDGCVTYKLSVQ